MWLVCDATAASLAGTSCSLLSLSALMACLLLSVWTNFPKIDDFVLGKDSKVIASDVGQWKVPPQQECGPCSLVPLVLHVFAKPLLLFIVVMMCNLWVVSTKVPCALLTAWTQLLGTLQMNSSIYQQPT